MASGNSKTFSEMLLNATQCYSMAITLWAQSLWGLTKDQSVAGARTPPLFLKKYVFR